MAILTSRHNVYCHVTFFSFHLFSLEFSKLKVSSTNWLKRLSSLIGIRLRNIIMTFYKVFHQNYKYGLNTLLRLMILTFKSTIALNLLLDNNKILRIMGLRTAKNVFKREGEVKKEMVRSKSLNLMFLRPNT